MICPLRASSVSDSLFQWHLLSYLDPLWATGPMGHQGSRKSFGRRKKKKGGGVGCTCRSIDVDRWLEHKVCACVCVSAWECVEVVKEHVKPRPLHHTGCQQRFFTSIPSLLTCLKTLIGSDRWSGSMKDVWFPLRILIAREIYTNLGSYWGFMWDVHHFLLCVFLSFPFPFLKHQHSGFSQFNITYLRKSLDTGIINSTRIKMWRPSDLTLDICIRSYFKQFRDWNIAGPQ